MDDWRVTERQMDKLGTARKRADRKHHRGCQESKTEILWPCGEGGHRGTI